MFLLKIYKKCSFFNPFDKAQQTDYSFSHYFHEKQLLLTNVTKSIECDWRFRRNVPKHASVSCDFSIKIPRNKNHPHPPPTQNQTHIQFMLLHQSLKIMFFYCKKNVSGVSPQGLKHYTVGASGLPRERARFGHGAVKKIRQNCKVMMILGDPKLEKIENYVKFLIKLARKEISMKNI